MQRFALALVILGSSLLAARAATPSNEPAVERSLLGNQVQNFTLRDYRGKEVSLADFKTGKPVVLAFLGTECPLARLYGPRLTELAAKYGPQGVTFLGIDSNKQDSITELASYARTHGVSFPLLKDPGNVVADQVGAERTPEIFLLDGQHVIRYHGHVDDQYGFQTGAGYAKSEIKNASLSNAIEELLAGKEITQAETKVVGCLIGRVREVDPQSPVTYSQQISRIMQQHCVDCHRPGEIGPFPLLTYDDVSGWGDMIAEVIRDQRMPPWHADPAVGHFSNDRSLSLEEKEQIYQWVAAGAPEGDPADLPAPKEFIEGWSIPEPDQVVYFADEPFVVPAEGEIPYQYFTVDPGWTEDKWIKATETRAGDRSVVHHIFVFAKPAPTPGSKGGGGFNLGAGGGNLISGTAPGNPPVISPPGMAQFVPAGSQLVFQMHYTANGKETKDRSCAGFVFADPKEVQQDVSMNMAINFAFRIPAGADNHPVEARKRFDRDTLIMNFTPHMHLRGKSFRYDLRYPDGSVETLLNVPQFDGNWQMTYNLVEPKLAPAGSELYCLAHFDNSADNLANPDPTTEVRWGDQTWEEMMIGWFGASTDVDTGLLPVEKRRTTAFLRKVAEKPLELKEASTSGKLSFKQLFDRLTRRVSKDVPQVDRMCAAVVDGDQVRFLQIDQTPVMEIHLGGTDTVLTADHALGVCAQAKQTTSYADLSKPEAAGLGAQRHGLRSSLHVPVEIDGQPGVVSFWSQELNAFPPQAVEYLEHVARQLGAAQADAVAAGN